jgi:hypothetical protein
MQGQNVPLQLIHCQKLKSIHVPGAGFALMPANLTNHLASGIYSQRILSGTYVTKNLVPKLPKIA